MPKIPFLNLPKTCYLGGFLRPSTPLATAAITGKDSIGALLKNNTLLAKTNTELSAVIKAQAAEIKSLTAGGGGKRSRGTGRAGGD